MATTTPNLQSAKKIIGEMLSAPGIDTTNGLNARSLRLLVAAVRSAYPTSAEQQALAGMVQLTDDESELAATLTTGTPAHQQAFAGAVAALAQRQLDASQDTIEIVPTTSN
jgi:hypothetical protein